MSQASNDHTALTYTYWHHAEPYHSLLVVASELVSLPMTPPFTKVKGAKRPLRM